MLFSRSLRLPKTPCLAFVGAGGKTTAISILAKELSRPLIITTTTHLGIWQTKIADRHFIIHKNSDIKKIDLFQDGITLITGGPDSDRLVGLNTDRMNLVYELCEKNNLPLLIECDGSHQLSIKAPGLNEPVIPDFVDLVVNVTGLSGLGKPLNRNVVQHPDIYSKLGNLPEGENISIASLAKLLAHNQGGLKNIPPKAKRILLINQADTISLQSQSQTLAHMLESSYAGIIVAELKKNKIHALFEPTAAIILAAGSSSRFGQTKQLLDYRGIPFIRAIVRSAIISNLSPILVITGANADSVSNALLDLPKDIIIIHNSNWENGQSTSIQAGIEALSRVTISKYLESNHTSYESGNTGSAIFLLADQPQVTPAIIRALVEEHSLTLAPVIAPLIGGKRGNPVIFDRDVFPELANLKGDIGGRGVFSKFPPVHIPWNDDSLLQDVDTPLDYERLLID